MSKQILILAFIFSILSSFFSCNEKYEKEVVSKYSNESAKKVQYYVWDGDKKVIIRIINYYPNGQKEIEEEVKNNKKHGICTYWHENGEKWTEETYKNGVKDGSFTVWYKSGKKNYAGTYSNGLPDGKWTFWGKKGKVSKEINYKMGEIVK